jgi:hypothetical protein
MLGGKTSATQANIAKAVGIRDARIICAAPATLRKLRRVFDSIGSYTLEFSLINAN